MSFKNARDLLSQFKYFLKKYELDVPYKLIYGEQVIVKLPNPTRRKDQQQYEGWRVFEYCPGIYRLSNGYDIDIAQPFSGRKHYWSSSSIGDRVEISFLPSESEVVFDFVAANYYKHTKSPAWISKRYLYHEQDWRHYQWTNGAYDEYWSRNVKKTPKV